MRSRDEVTEDIDDELFRVAGSTPPLAAMAPRGAEDLFFRLFALRASRHPHSGGLLTPTGRLRRWVGKLAAACATEVRPYVSAVARGLDPGSLEALSRLPPEALQIGERPAIERLAQRLEGLADADPAVVPQRKRAWVRRSQLALLAAPNDGPRRGPPGAPACVHPWSSTGESWLRTGGCWNRRSPSS